MRIGVDAGGTFTDFVVLRDDGRVEAFKLRSDAAAPAKVILAGLARAAAGGAAEVVHGSTVATNALLERKGARTALVTTAGFEDLVFIGRQNRAELYNLAPAPRRWLVGEEMCFGVRERAYYDGTIERRPSERELARLRKTLRDAGAESVAICFLHAYRTAENEEKVVEALRGAGYISASHDVCPEFREYERASTTLINAYVGPLMDGYLGELERGGTRIAILQSNGGTLDTKEARRHAVRTILSGPAGGAIGAFETARASGFARILGFDMGGTSTDVSLCDGAPRETTEGAVDGFPIRVPMLDIHTVGAGGGSIARVDEGGLLRVGPESAGSRPGPACYGSGEEATVTDAHVVLGRIAEDQLVAGEMRLDAARAGAAVDRVAARLRMDRVRAAAGIVRVANANMERAIRVVSVERGYDPREFALVAFGGCGGLHACEIAEALDMRTVIVPAHAGALSALGMLLADAVRDFAAGALGRGNFEALFRGLEKKARAKGARLERSADVRYAGQGYELNVPWNAKDPGEPFHREHQRVYGYCDQRRPVEVVTLRVRARVVTEKPRIAARVETGCVDIGKRKVYSNGRWRWTPVLARNAVPKAKTDGPALIADYGATTMIPPGWRFHLDRCGALILERS